jgi:hypothetical protein
LAYATTGSETLRSGRSVNHVVLLPASACRDASARPGIAADLRGDPDLGALMFTPYLRVLPMHLGIIFVAGAGDGTWLRVRFTVLFTVPNTASNLALDAIDRRWAEENVARTGGMHDTSAP